MEIELPYGSDRIKVELSDPSKVKIGETPETESRENPEKSVREALDEPIGERTIEEIAESKERPAGALSVAIIIDDRTRACPDDLLVPILVDRLTAAGVDSEKVKVVVATGLHEPPDRSEAMKLAGGEKLPDGIDYIGHDAVNSEISSVGKVSQGYDVRINNSVAGADLIISTGFIEPHFFAGFSGGRKSILPGVASKSSILANHSYENIGAERASTGVLSGNPVHEGATEAAELAGLDFILNVVLNKEQEIVDAVAGDFREAFLKGVTSDLDVSGVELERSYEAVLTTNSGYPLDQDLYQTVKGMYTASLVAKPGAPIVIASECSAGVGPDNFYTLSKDRADSDSVLNYIEKNGPIIAQWENQVLCEVLQEHEVFIKSSLSDDLVEDMMLKPIENLQGFVEELSADLEVGEKLLVLPEGPFSLPYVKGSELESLIAEYRE
ncbi:nickel-dependent lactate racemase [Candidatus Bipolaricaulota bacterium]|nr:nickel-dependent lactate racemase [Candidatus Bipolaricaulota bacterium]